MEKLVVYTDGGARGNPGPAAVGVHVEDESGQVLMEDSATIGNGTNNFAEYAAVLHALELLKRTYGAATKRMSFELRLDSELVKKQLNGEYQVKDPGLVPLFMQLHNLRVSHFPQLTFTHIPRTQNTAADALVNEALDAPASTA